METMRDSWTDERLDDFAANTERRFDRIEARFDRLENRMEQGFARLDMRIDQLSQTMFRTMTGLIVTMALGFASLLVAGP
jgi:hypothetical protein